MLGLYFDPIWQNKTLAVRYLNAPTCYPYEGIGSEVFVQTLEDCVVEDKRAVLGLPPLCGAFGGVY